MKKEIRKNELLKDNETDNVYYLKIDSILNRIKNNRIKNKIVALSFVEIISILSNADIDVLKKMLKYTKAYHKEIE